MRGRAVAAGTSLGPALALVLSIAACSKSPAEPDCQAIVRDPARGLEMVTSFTSDPVRMWSVLEACFAPGGDTCARAAVGGAMTPGMTIAEQSAGAAAGKAPREVAGSGGDAAHREEGWRQWAARCRRLPAEQQQCLVLSYQLGHPGCAKIADELRTTLR
jgi:hypothetical protein